jgi:hypothetical protein
LKAVIGHERRHLNNQDLCGVVFQINYRWQCKIELLAKLHNLHCRYFRLKIWSTIRHRELELIWDTCHVPICQGNLQVVVLKVSPVAGCEFNVFVIDDCCKINLA